MSRTTDAVARACLGGLALTIGCASAELAEAPARRAELAALELERGPTVWSPPQGADGPSHFEVGWAPGGPVFPAPATASRAWGDAAAVLDGERALHRFHRDGRVEPIADRVSGMIVSGDGQRLAYTTGDVYGPMDVRIVSDDDGETRVVAREVLAPSLLSFEQSGSVLFLLAAGPGGVMGLHVIELDGAPALRCLTNCALRTGTAWGDAFVAPPAAWDEVIVDASTVRYRDESGQPTSVSWREVAP